MVAITETETPKTEVKTEKTSMASRATNYLTSWIPTIPYTLDDLWALIEKLKANFSHGLFEGLEETLQDVILWVTSWQIWQNPSVQEWLQYFLELADNVAQKLESWWDWIYHHEKMPGFVQTRLDFLKIDVFLDNFRQVLSNQQEKLVDSTSASSQPK